MSRARSDGGYRDTSGRELGRCPRCDEVVALYRGGRVEPHRELLHTLPVPSLGGKCPASNEITVYERTPL